MRAFLAFKLTDEIRDFAVEAISSFSSILPFGVKWVETENLHVTLSFLGDVNENLVDEIYDIVEEVFSQIDKIEFKMEVIELIPAKKPSLICIKLSCNILIDKIVGTMNKKLSRICPNIDIKSYKPHITIGRIKGVIPTPVMNKYIGYLLSDYKFRVPEITLFKSTLSKKGPHYIPLFDYEF